MERYACHVCFAVDCLHQQLTKAFDNLRAAVDPTIATSVDNTQRTDWAFKNTPVTRRYVDPFLPEDRDLARRKDCTDGPR